MERDRIIKGLVEDPRFKYIEDYILEMAKDWKDQACEKKKNIEETAINTIENASKSQACFEILESLYTYAGKSIREKIENINND